MQGDSNCNQQQDTPFFSIYNCMWAYALPPKSLLVISIISHPQIDSIT